MTILRRAIALCGFAGLVLAPTAAFSVGDGTPDESPPAEEAVCDESGLIGAAFGLCIAFCEANDCDQFPNKKACDVLRENYSQITGEVAFPCEAVSPPPGDS